MASIEVDGKTLIVENGKSIIEVADEAGIHIPRFCYHKKLSVAANCRMCLVEVENGRKTVPACATPITDGMKVYTKSAEAVRSQKAVMEFLLINHPLDCPICDQGGECELQDVSMGHGGDSSEYQESKRAVKSDDLGSLIDTEMTRCIHCTRCVRFGEEVAGFRELGATSRGEDMQIGTYVKHGMESEVSANIIDLCPVGALTSKPFRYKARAWEMSQHEAIAPHDCIGSNLYTHVRRNELMRVVPRENDDINETWISDRDRFSYAAMNSDKRAATPMIKRQGQWESVAWEDALEFVAEGLNKVLAKHGKDQIAGLASPSATTEELYLLQKWMRALGVYNLDSRLQQTDFRDEQNLPIMPTSSLKYSDLENQDAILVFGCNINREQPVAGIRLRKAFLNNDAKIYAINPVDYDFHVELADKKIVVPHEMTIELGKIIVALANDELPLEIKPLVLGLKPDKTSQSIAKALVKKNATIVTGAISQNHPDAALITTFINLIAKLSGAKVLRFTQGANAAGASLAGMLPHVGPAGRAQEQKGLNIQEALDAHLKGYVLLNAEPEYDFANPYGARQAMLAAEFVVSMSAFDDEAVRQYADVILPIAPYSETSGTTINVDNTWQNFTGCVAPFKEARPAWKVLRVLGNFMDCPGFNFVSSDEVCAEIEALFKSMPEKKYLPFYPEEIKMCKEQYVRVGEWPLYRADSIVRRATPLQTCPSHDKACIRVHTNTANKLKLGEAATISQGNIEITLPVVRDDRVAIDAIWVANAHPETADLGHSFSAIKCKQ